MRILFLSSVFPQPGNSLRGVYSLRLCRALADQHEVKVIAPRSWLDSWRACLRGRGLDTSLIAALGGLQAYYPSFYYPPGLLFGAHSWFMWLSSRRTFGHVVKDFHPQCIVSYWAYPDGAVAVRAAQKAGIPSIILVGGSDVLLLPTESRRTRLVLSALQSASAVVTVGTHLRKAIEEIGIRPEKVHVVPRGIDANSFAPGSQREARANLGLSTDCPMLLWVGRMVPVKGLTTLIQACAMLRDDGMRFRLYLLGDGPVRTSVERSVRIEKLDDRITFIGNVSPEQLPDWYRAADVTVLPSQSEGVPNVLRESLACGTPFVASDVGGIPELARPEQDRLVPPGDPHALAVAIRAAIANRSDRRVPVVPQMTWRESADRLVRVIEPLLPATP